MSVKYAPRADVTTQVVDDEILVLDLRNNQIHQLNSTASFIWKLCQGGDGADTICRAVSAHFDIDEETARRDTVEALRNWEQLGLIEEVSD